MKVAITGASGFVGNRLVEKFYLEKLHDVRAIVRGTWGLAMPARFDIDWKVCDHFDVTELSRAFEGCDAVVHAALGAPYKEMAQAIYSGANSAGVKQVIVLSSASIYNQNPASGTTEDSPLPAKSMFRYNSEKIEADAAVRRLRARGQSEVAFLMPGIVYGPRSRWISNIATDVINDTAYLINDGKGICNAIYIDNLIEAVRLCLTAKNIDGQSFFVSDAETITWRDFYRPLVTALGRNIDELPVVEGVPLPKLPIAERLRERILIGAESRRVQNLKPRMPATLKKVFKTIVATRRNKAAVNDWEPLQPRRIEASPEMTALQQCVYKLPNAKAERLLNFVPPVAFGDAISRSIAWLKFAGFPVDGETASQRPRQTLNQISAP